MAEQAVKDVLDRQKKLKDARQPWEPLWQELAEVFLPRRADFTHQTKVDGDDRQDDIYDSMPIQARRGLASAIDALIKPKTTKWFHIRANEDAVNDDDAARAWFEAAEDRMWNAIYSRNARFIQRTGEVDNDLVTLGTGVLFIGEAKSVGTLSFRSMHLRDCYIAENADGVIDTNFIEMELTARQAAQRYGEDRLGQATRELLRDGKEDTKCEFTWAVKPRDDYDLSKVDQRSMLYSSTVIDVKSEHKVTEGGFPEFPFAVPRWDTTTNEVYGRSPAMVALPDAQTLQAMGKTILMQAQYAVDPPKWIPSEGVLSAVRSYPGGMTVIDADYLQRLGGRPPIGELTTAGNFVLGLEMQNATRESIWAAFFKNVLNLPVNGPQMTATEVVARKEELLRGIGPVFGQLESDYVGHIVERVFGIMMRAGAFPMPPEILQGRDVRFEFESPLVKARKAIEAQGFMQAMEMMQPLAMIDPTIMDHFNGDAIARDTPDIFGLPTEWLRGVEEVQALRDSRADAAEAAEMAETVTQGAEVASKVVPLLRGPQQQGRA